MGGPFRCLNARSRRCSAALSEILPWELPVGSPTRGTGINPLCKLFSLRRREIVLVSQSLMGLGAALAPSQSSMSWHVTNCPPMSSNWTSSIGVPGEHLLAAT
jgi:hypothetical protein